MASKIIYHNLLNVINNIGYFSFIDQFLIVFRGFSDYEDLFNNSQLLNRLLVTLNPGQILSQYFSFYVAAKKTYLPFCSSYLINFRLDNLLIIYGLILDSNCKKTKF